MKQLEQSCYAMAEPGVLCRRNHANTSGGWEVDRLCSASFQAGNMSDATVMLAAIKAGDSLSQRPHGCLIGEAAVAPEEFCGDCYRSPSGR